MVAACSDGFGILKPSKYQSYIAARFKHGLLAKRFEVVEKAMRGWETHIDVHVPDMSNVGGWIRNCRHLLDFLYLNWLRIFLVLLQVENDSGGSVQYS